MSIATIIAGLIQVVLMTSVGYLLVVVFLRQKSNQLYRLLLLILICVFIGNVGYLLELRATNAGEALVALRTYYIASPFTATLFFALTLTYFNIRLPKTLFIIICAIGALVSFSVWTCEFNPLYYTSASFAADAELPHTVLGKGPLYIVFAVVNVSQIVACLVISTLALIRSKDKKQRKIHWFLVLSTLAPLLCYPLGISGIMWEGYDPVPAGTALGAIFYSFAVLNQHAFELVDVAYKKIIRTMNEAVLIADYNFGFTEANERALSLFPRLREYKKGQTIIQESYPFSDTNEAEITVGERVFSVHQNTIMDKDFLSGYAFVLVDITQERKQLEHMQLLKEKADSANQAKSTFLAHISHEIRTPINAVSGMNEMILRTSAEVETKKYAFEVKSAVNTLLSIISDILDFSKIESGMMKIVEGDYELSRLLNDVFNMTSVKAKEKNLELVFDISPELPRALWGDDIRIRQILLNLLSNGVKYTREGKVTLRVTGRVQDERATLRFVVADTGIGIKQEELPKLFEAFERIDAERNRHIEGTGLGMSIVAQLLKMMGSSLEVASVYGQGSVFSFTLEQGVVCSAPIGEFLHLLSADSYAYTASFTAPEAKVLVVDDSRTNRMVFRELLKDTKVRVYEAESGPACIEAVKSESFDVIFMDDMMPDMSGAETLQILKDMQDNRSKQAPVIMLTANAILGAKEKFLKLGFSDFLTKPIDPVKLEATLGHSLNPRHVIWSDTSLKNAEASADYQEALPEIEGADWESARRHLPGNALIRQTALQFLESIPEAAAQLQELIGNIDDEKARDAYRILVHTVKGTAAMLGFLSLSGFAQIVETAAQGADTARLTALHPVFIDELNILRIRLQAFTRHNAAGKESQEPERVLELIAWLKSALSEHDYDVADNLAAELARFMYPEDIQRLMDALQVQIMNLASDAAIATASELEARLGAKEEE